MKNEIVAFLNNQEGDILCIGLNDDRWPLKIDHDK